MIIPLLILVLRLAVDFQSDRPQFKGGPNNLDAFIKNNLLYPEYSKANCLQGTIHIQFKLNRRGQIYDSEVKKGFAIDLDDEALRLIRLSSGKWIIPANYDTTTAIVLPVNFALKDYDCEERDKDDLNAAIAAYHARADLTKAIFNYYDKKTIGEARPDEELRIAALKVQLGYNEKYISRFYKQALRKLKQGDKESACEDLLTVRRLGSDLAEESIKKNCR